MDCVKTEPLFIVTKQMTNIKSLVCVAKLQLEI